MKTISRRLIVATAAMLLLGSLLANLMRRMPAENYQVFDAQLRQAIPENSMVLANVTDQPLLHKPFRFRWRSAKNKTNPTVLERIHQEQDNKTVTYLIDNKGTRIELRCDVWEGDLMSANLYLIAGEMDAFSDTARKLKAKFSIIRCNQ